MTHTTPLPPLPDIPALTTTRHPVLARIAADLTNRPARRCAHYEDSPYIAAAHAPDPEPDEDDGPWCAASRP